MSKSYLLRMSEEQHSQAKGLAKKEGISMNDLFLTHTLPNTTPRTPGIAYSSLQSEVQSLAFRIENLEGQIAQGQVALGGKEPQWQQPQSPAVVKRSKRSSR